MIEYLDTEDKFPFQFLPANVVSLMDEVTHRVVISNYPDIKFHLGSEVREVSPDGFIINRKRVSATSPFLRELSRGVTMAQSLGIFEYWKGIERIIDRLNNRRYLQIKWKLQLGMCSKSAEPEVSGKQFVPLSLVHLRLIFAILVIPNLICLAKKILKVVFKAIRCVNIKNV